jgi:hypothetical protein
VFVVSLTWEMEHGSKSQQTTGAILAGSREAAGGERSVDSPVLHCDRERISQASFFAWRRRLGEQVLTGQPGSGSNGS